MPLRVSPGLTLWKVAACWLAADLEPDLADFVDFPFLPDLDGAGSLPADATSEPVPLRHWLIDDQGASHGDGVAAQVVPFAQLIDGNLEVVGNRADGVALADLIVRGFLGVGDGVTGLAGGDRDDELGAGPDLVVRRGCWPRRSRWSRCGTCGRWRPAIRHTRPGDTARTCACRAESMR